MDSIPTKKSYTQDNDLIGSNQSLSFQEKRLFILILLKVNPQTYPENKLEVTVSLPDWLEYFPYTTGYKKFADLEKSTESLSSAHYIEYVNDSVRDRINFFERVRFDKTNKSVKFTFTNIAKTKVMGLQEKFTRIEMLSIANISNMYGLRLYELLWQYKDHGWKYATIEELRFTLNCVDQYPTIKLFNFHVLNPAMKEIKDKSNIDVHKVEKIKKGRSIIAYKLFFHTKN